MFMFSISTQLAFNAIFYSDDYIDQRANETIRNNGDAAAASSSSSIEDSQGSNTGFFYTLINEFSKSLSATLISLLINFLGSNFLSLPDKYEYEFNEHLKTQDVDIIYLG